jgi:hypothetical protein
VVNGTKRNIVFAVFAALLISRAVSAASAAASDEGGAAARVGLAADPADSGQPVAAPAAPSVTASCPSIRLPTGQTP